MALENSKASLLAALDHNIDAIEFDVRRTKDNKLVVLHDRHTGRISKHKTLIGNKTLAELQAIKLNNGQHILSFDEVFDLLAEKISMVIDIKDHNSADEIIRVIGRNPLAEVSFTSLQYTELNKLHDKRPDIPIFVRDLLNPVELVQTAKRMKASGISLNMWLMNPLTYWLARRSNLEVRVYTVNHAILGRLLQKIYPGIVLYTNNPQKFVGKKKRPLPKAKVVAKSKRRLPRTPRKQRT